MAKLWIQTDNQWNAIPLDRSIVSLAISADNPIVADADDAIASLSLLDDQRHTCALLTRPDAPLRVNSESLQLGIRALHDRDAIQLTDGRVLFFSTDVAPAIIPLPGDRSLTCVRCMQPIEPGASAVQCPRCRAWHHQTEGLGCWTYADRCAACQEELTSLDAEHLWSPEGL